MTARRAPNRAQRLIVQARLDRAVEGADLLRTKEDVLGRERQRLLGHATRTEQEWTEHCVRCTEWLQRALLLGGGSELDGLVAARLGGASVTIEWQHAMGVSYPGDVASAVTPATGLNATAALAAAGEAMQEALAAGVVHAAARAALSRLDDELRATRRRRRAIEQRLVPRLERELRQLDLDLDEREREEAARRRLAVRSGQRMSR
ncbi:MAG: hypothetical protein KDB21_03840 [Acidimicrobiales bacterium]|nr:hypothetical protein [Acidimicrobiales bacterium]